MLGVYSTPPIRKSPWWLDGSLLQAVGSSPYVGWLSNTLPIFFQSSIPFSKSNLQETFNKQKEKKIPLRFKRSLYSKFLQRTIKKFPKTDKHKKGEQKKKKKQTSRNKTEHKKANIPTNTKKKLNG